MALIINTEDGPVDHAFLDGYQIEERKLEGVMFRIEIQGGKVVCTGHDGGSYMADFSAKAIEGWKAQAVEPHNWNSYSQGGKDCWIADESDPESLAEG